MRSLNTVERVFPRADTAFCRFMALALQVPFELLQDIGVEGAHSCLEARNRYRA